MKTKKKIALALSSISFLMNSYAVQNLEKSGDSTPVEQSNNNNSNSNVQHYKELLDLESTLVQNEALLKNITEKLNSLIGKDKAIQYLVKMLRNNGLLNQEFDSLTKAEIQSSFRQDPMETGRYFFELPVRKRDLQNYNAYLLKLIAQRQEILASTDENNIYNEALKSQRDLLEVEEQIAKNTDTLNKITNSLNSGMNNKAFQNMVNTLQYQNKISYLEAETKTHVNEEYKTGNYYFVIPSQYNLKLEIREYNQLLLKLIQERSELLEVIK